MTSTPPPSSKPTQAPAAFREALAELVQVGMSVARMLGRAADMEMKLADNAVHMLEAENTLQVAATVAEAIEADRIAIEAVPYRKSGVERSTAIAESFAQVSRAVRRTVLLAERLDRGWARRSAVDDRFAMARRQITRGVSDAIAQSAEGARAEQMFDRLADRLDAPDTLEEIGTRPAEEIIEDICRDLGIDPARIGPSAAPGGGPPSPRHETPQGPARAASPAAVRESKPPPWPSAGG